MHRDCIERHIITLDAPCEGDDADAGGSARLLATNDCGQGMDAASLLLPQRHDVILECNSADPAQVVNGVAVTVFFVIATVTRGQYGSPEFISRQRTVRITT